MTRRTLDWVIVGVLVAFGLGFYSGYAPQHNRITRQASCIQDFTKMSQKVPDVGQPMIHNRSGHVWSRGKTRAAYELTVKDSYAWGLLESIKYCDEQGGFATPPQWVVTEWLFNKPAEWMAKHYRD